MTSAVVVPAGSISAVLLLIAADAKLDERKQALFESECAQQIDVPIAATAYNWSATALLLVTAVAALVLIVSVIRIGSVALTVPTCIVGGLVFVISVGYALLVGYTLIDPSAEEPVSPHYHPCAGRF